MNEHEFREILKRSVPPMADTELRHDLWPRMLRRLDQRAVRVPWFDWALGALLAAWLLAFPAAIPTLLYHL